MKTFDRSWVLALAGIWFVASTALADPLTMKDPVGDDNGPGNYVYPTDAVYTPGAFDLIEFEVEAKGKYVNFDVTMNDKMRDPWGMDVGFAVQMVFIFIDTGDGGNTQGLPGLNIQFADDSAWEKVIIMSPQPQARVMSEVRAKIPADLQGAIIAPRRTTGSGRSIATRIKVEDVGAGDPETWGYQVVVQSNEGFPAKTDLLTRKVNEYEGQHRFGGGNDADCDPHVMDILAPNAEGADSEKEGQYEMLSYECGPDGEAVKMATLSMIRR